MSEKRGSSGLSLVVGIDKPAGISAHDVVNRCRRIFNERRVGHTGTLDPLATGAMIVCVGPATRLDAYLEADTKEYDARIQFGTATDTDDAEGSAVHTAPVPTWLSDADRAREALAGMVGTQNQMPPLYSAIKVNGVKGYEAARAGKVIALQPRTIEVQAARLKDIGADEQGRTYWDASFSVSKGTYIRSLARDLGRSCGTVAHLAGLRRTRSGRLLLDDCVTLEQMERDGRSGRLDPVRLLGYRVLFCDQRQGALVRNGGRLRAEGLSLRALPRSVRGRADDSDCPWTYQAHPDLRPLAAGEIISVVCDNALQALYEFDAERGIFRPCCVFSQGVTRGSDI